MVRNVWAEKYAEAKADMEKSWSQVYTSYEGLADIVGGLPAHRLHPSISRFFNLTEGWSRFKSSMAKKGFVPLFSDIRNVQSFPLSYGVDGKLLKLWLHVPFKRADSSQWQLLSWTNSPWISERHVIRVAEPEKILAVRGSSSMELDRHSLEKMTKVSDLYIMTTAAKEDLKPNSCLAALKAEDYDLAAKLCVTTLEDRRIEAWNVNEDEYVIDAMEGVNYKVMCGTNNQLQDTGRFSGVVKITFLNKDCYVTVEDCCVLRPARIPDYKTWEIKGTPGDFVYNISKVIPEEESPPLRAPKGILDTIYKGRKARENHSLLNSAAISFSTLLLFIIIVVIILSCCLHCCR